MAFYIGQKVVCVNAAFTNPWQLNYMSAPVVEGQIYTIRKIGVDTKDRPVVALEEILGDYFPNCVGEWC